MNKILAFLLVVLVWLFLPLINVVLSIGVAFSIFMAGSQVLYEYFVNELNERKKK